MHSLRKMKPESVINAVPCRKCGWIHSLKRDRRLLQHTDTKSNDQPTQHQRRLRSQRYRWRQFLKQAKQRNITVLFDFAFFQNLITQHCHYCNQVPTAEKRMGIDRLESSGSYEANNVVPSCATCNYMKGTMSKHAFLSHVSLIYDATNLPSLKL